MTTYLIEIGLEEVPARFMPGILADLKTRWETSLTHHRIGYESVHTTGTYRRLVTQINGIATETRADQTRIRGPITSIAIGADGELTPAGLGFLKKNNLSSYVTETDGNKEYIVGYIALAAQPIQDILGTIAAEVSLGIKLPIAMTWGTGIGPFIRPIHWIVSLLNTEHIPVQLFDIASGTTTLGHRFLGHATPIEIPSADHYFTLLPTHFVQPDHHKRHTQIELALKTAMGPNGSWDADLVDEVVFLTEWPTALTGTIDDVYMTLPQPAIVECIQKNQKYFPVIQNQTLTASYVIIADSITDANHAIILRGNHSVLRARLEDVKFFWEMDLKTPLSSQTDKLKSIVYQKGLGSVWDKTQRIETIATTLAPLVGATDTELVSRAAALCKTDLVSQMVLEMPSLQGVMGGIYATHSGEHPDVSTAISELYCPEINTEHPVATAIAIADRLDTVVSCFANGLIPTGSQDPWGVRRAALGIVRAARNLRLSLSLSELVDIGYRTFNSIDHKNKEKCVEFMADRLKYILESDDASPEFIRCAFAANSPTIDRILSSLVQLEESRSFPEFKALVETAVRIQRLSEKHSGSEFNAAQLDPEEKKLVEAILPFLDIPVTHIDQLIPFAITMPTYFEKILVMDPDSRIRENRLGLLKKIHTRFSDIGNFEYISVP